MKTYKLEEGMGDTFLLISTDAEGDEQEIGIYHPADRAVEFHPLVYLGLNELESIVKTCEEFVVDSELRKTMEWDEHPEEHDGPCLCKSCCSYA